MTRISAYPAWSDGLSGVSTAKDVAVAWRNMISTFLDMDLMGHADLPKPLPLDSQLCWGKQSKALSSVHHCAGGRNAFLHSPCNIP